MTGDVRHVALGRHIGHRLRDLRLAGAEVAAEAGPLNAPTPSANTAAIPNANFFTSVLLKLIADLGRMTFPTLVSAQ